MPTIEKHPWLIAYDIRDPKRLTRVHKYLVDTAIPVQYSVFKAELTNDELVTTLQDLSLLIDPERDDIRCYPLTNPLEYDHYGRQEVSGMLLLGNR